MNLLLIGVVLWSVIHFIPGLAPDFREQLKQKLGEKAYPAAFAIGIVVSIALMVTGWRSGVQISLYEPPEWGHPVGRVFILIAFLLFGLAQATTNVKRFIRHPQLTGMVAWAIGHLMANGDNLSLTLFGGLGVWALIEILLINRREGAWRKPPAVPLISEIKPILIGLVIYAVFFVAHPYLFGVSPIQY